MFLKDVLRPHSSIAIDASFDMAREMILSENVDFLIVTIEGRPVGILSSFELLKQRLGDETAQSIEGLMNHNILIFNSHEDTQSVSKVLLDHGQWVAVVVDKGSYKGIVTPRSLFL